MKNIERGTIRYLIVLIITVSLCGIILYPLLDLVYYKLIVNSNFVYSFYNHVISPILFAVIFSVTFWLINRGKK